MASSRRSRRRKQAVRRHRMKLEALEKRYALNAAPVLDPTASPQLNSILEDAGVPIGSVGTLVSSLIDSGAPDKVLDFPAAVLPGITIGNLPSGYETSGLTWHDGLQKLFAVSDEGIISMMNADGTELVNWNVLGDLEALTVADHTSTKIYIGVEHPDSILEFDVSTGQVTRAFELTNWMTGADSKGLEALAFVPDATDPEGGLFYAGLQEDGRVYQFSLPIATSSSSNAVKFVKSISIEGGSTDLAGLTYESSSGQLLAIYDSIDQLNVIDRDGQLRSRWNVPGAGQEAVVFIDGHLYVGDDTLCSITQYSGFDALIETGGRHNNFSDADCDLPGIAITGVNVQGGTLWYSLDNGVNWSIASDISEDHALGLAANPLTRIYYEPVENYAGTIADALTIRAWDGYGSGAASYGRPSTTPAIVATALESNEFRSAIYSSDGTRLWATRRDSGIEVFDVSSTGDTFLLGSYATGGRASGIALTNEDSRLVVSDEITGLHILDVTSPAAISEISTLAAAKDGVDVAISENGSIAYIAAGRAGVHVVDLSDPYNPMLLATVSTSGEARSVTLSPWGTHVYVAALDAGVEIINVENPALPFLAGSTPTGGWARDIAVFGHENLAFVAAGSGISIVNVSTPASPAVVGRLAPPDFGEAFGVSLSPYLTTLYVAAGKSGLQVIDVVYAGPTAILTPVGHIDTSGWAHSTALSPVSQTVAIADGNNGLVFIDVTSRDQPTSAPGYPASLLAGLCVTSDGSRSFVAAETDGLRIVDTTNPLAPKHIGSFQPGGRTVGAAVAKDGGIAFVANGQNGIRVVAVEESGATELLSTITFEQKFAYSALLSENEQILYVGLWGGGIRVLDVQNPQSPQIIGSLEAPGDAVQLTLSKDGGLLYVASGLAGLQIVDVSNPSAMNIIGSFDTVGRTWSARLSRDETTVFLAEGTSEIDESFEGSGLVVVDVRQPQQPQLISRLATPGDSRAVSLSPNEEEVYLNDGDRGLLVIDVRNKTEPTIFATVNTPGWLVPSNEVAYGGKFIFTVDQKGLLVVELGKSVSSVTDTISLTVAPVNDGPSLDAISDLIILEDASVQVVTLTGISARGGEAQPLRVTATSSDTGLIPHPTVTYASADTTGSLAFTPVADANGTATITVTVEDGGFDNDLNTAEDNATATRTFDVLVEPVNDAPVCPLLLDVVMGEWAGGFYGNQGPGRVFYLGAEEDLAGGNEKQAVRVIVSGEGANVASVGASRMTVRELSDQTRDISFWQLEILPIPYEYGAAEITLTVEDSGLDGDLSTAVDNLKSSRSFFLSVVPSRDNPHPRLVGKVYVNQLLDADSSASYRIPAVNINGEPVNGLKTRIAGVSSDTAIIPDATTLYGATDVAASLSFTPVAGAHGRVTFTINVEDGGPDNDLATGEDNRTATHLAEVTVLKIIADSGSAILSQDPESNVYADTQPITLDEQQAQTDINGFAAIGAEATSAGNAVLVQREGTTYRLVAENTWQIIGMFDSLQNTSSTVLSPVERAPVEFALTVIPGTYLYVTDRYLLAASARPWGAPPDGWGVDTLTLTVHRGQKVIFDLNVTGHPFYLQTTGNGYVPANVYSEGFSGNGQTSGRYEWIVPEDAPDELFYQCEFHPVMFGKIVVVD
jgi:uncharacterized protein YjiK